MEDHESWARTTKENVGRSADCLRMQRYLSKLGVAICTVAGVICAILHFATFITLLPPLWIVPPLALVLGAMICTHASKSELSSRDWGRVSLGLLFYAILSFVQYYRATDLATGTSVVNGQYVYMYKSQVIRTITEHEYRIFPNRVTRFMSAWIGMLAVLALNQSPQRNR